MSVRREIDKGGNFHKQEFAIIPSTKEWGDILERSGGESEEKRR